MAPVVTMVYSREAPAQPRTIYSIPKFACLHTNAKRLPLSPTLLAYPISP
jgi:hypothetical protein